MAWRGHRVGSELLVDRRSALGLSGWASYSLGRSRCKPMLHAVRHIQG